MGEWQPIETAPKDGTWILLYLSEDGWKSDADGDYPYRVTIGQWDADTYQSATWMSDKTYTEFWDYGGMTGAGTSTYRVEVIPSHWMPLPDAPNG